MLVLSVVSSTSVPVDCSHEYLEEYKPIVVILVLHSPELKLRNNLVAVGMKDSQQVEDVIDIIELRIQPVILILVVKLVAD